MEKHSLSNLFSGKIFRIPDYQRGYAWKKKQWGDFVEDVDALVTDSQIKSHYTGTVVTFDPKSQSVPYNRKTVTCLDIVDGQQRLTTVCLYLSVIIRNLIEKGETGYEQDIPEFLYHGETCKLTLANDTEDLFIQLLKKGVPRVASTTEHQKRLCLAVEFFAGHVQKAINDPARGVEFVKKLFEAITGQLVFTYYSIDEECEIGMTFELMNSRGKGLSVLELLKNYLMHWISRNAEQGEERQNLTKLLNGVWKGVYVNVGASTGSESQCLRVAWTLYCHHLPKNWQGYDGFKGKDYIPLRDFSAKSLKSTRGYLERFTNGLADVSTHYAIVVSPTELNTKSKEEFQWLNRIHNTGNVANFLPLMVAARMKLVDGKVAQNDYIALLTSLECFVYRVFLVEGKRSNAGKSRFFRWGKELFDGKLTPSEITTEVYGLIHYYAQEEKFAAQMQQPFHWYGKKLLKYTLFEYEQYLLDTESKGQKPRITWADLAKDSTLEHILPQTPEAGSHWLKVWSQEDIDTYQHDIGNIVLTRDNSSYKNFEFARKKGQQGSGTCYANSDIRQERKIADYSDWDVDSLRKRRESIVPWILEHWKSIDAPLNEDIIEYDDEDSEDSEELS